MFRSQEDKSIADGEIHDRTERNGEEICWDIVQPKAVDEQSHENEIAHNGDRSGSEIKSHQPAENAIPVTAATVDSGPAFMPHKVV